MRSIVAYGFVAFLCVFFVLGAPVATAAVWTAAFEGYADDTALRADYIKGQNNSGTMTQAAYEIYLVADPDGVSGNCVEMQVTPGSHTGNNDPHGVYLIDDAGGGGWPSGTFQNGTDFRVYYDFRQSSFESYMQKACSPGLCVPVNYDADANQDLFYIFTQSNYDGGHPDQWGLSAWCVEGDQSNPYSNSVDGDSVPYSALYAVNTWYRCRIDVDWVNDGVTTNTNVNLTFHVWNRASGSEGTATVYTFTGSLYDDRLLLGARTGDYWGFLAMIYNSSAGNYSIWYDRIAFTTEGSDPFAPDVTDWSIY